MKRKFEIVLGMLESKTNMVIDFTTENLTSDIYKACDSYNIYQKGKQNIFIKEIKKSFITIELTISIEENEQFELYRKVSLFSRRLADDFNWRQFSNKKNRLLTIVSYQEINVEEHTETLIIDVNLQEQNDSVIDMRKEKLKFLYAQKRYIDLQIQQLEKNYMKEGN